MSNDTKKEYTIEQLIAALDNFDKQPEIQMLFRRGNKYVTNIDTRLALSPEVKAMLVEIEAMIQDVLVDESGRAYGLYWAKLQHYNGGGHFWVRFKDPNPTEAILSLRSISIAFPCKKA